MGHQPPFPPAIPPARRPSDHGRALERVKNYRQRAAHQLYQPGSFVPHVRMVDTGRRTPIRAANSACPMSTSAPRAITTRRPSTNWQLCGTQAYSLYAGKTREIDEAAADQSLRAIVRFLNSRSDHPQRNHAGSRLRHHHQRGYDLRFRNERRASAPRQFAGAHVRRGEAARLLSSTLRRLRCGGAQSPGHGHVLFMQDGPFITEHSPVFQVLAGA